MSRRSRHGRRPQMNAADALPRSGTATAPGFDESPAAAPFAPEPHAPQPHVPEPHAPEVRAEPVESPAPMPAMAAEPVNAAELEPALEPEAPRTTCTQAQLRRFIKSRPWIPMHELRRRFGIYGGDDDVTPVRTSSGMIFVGLPNSEGRMLGELIVSGDVGYELSLDPGAPIVVGVYPMRPVPRG